MPTVDHLRTGQRATKIEREEVMQALKEIWETASETSGEVEFVFPASPAGQHECRSLYYGLIDFRKKIQKKKLEQYHLWNQINGLQLCKAADDSRVFFRKKIGEVSGRSLVILNAAARMQKAVDLRVECPVMRIDRMNEENDG